MTVPGVNVTRAASFLAAIGDIRRFKGSRKAVAYLGLDPRVHQSGTGPARGERIPKQGSPRARWALVEAARSVAQQPEPMHALDQRLRTRKGHNPAVVAVARKLAVLFYSMLTREQDYVHLQPSLTELKLRRARDRRRRADRQREALRRWAPRERCATPRTARPAGRGLPPALDRRLGGNIAEREGSGRERDTGARIVKPLKGKSHGRPVELQTPALRPVIGSRPPTI